MSRATAALVFVSVASLGGCDISAQPFAGTIAELSIAGAQPTPPGQHLELWARNKYGDIVRINTNNENHSNPAFPDGSPGYLIVNAITMSDPCLIDAHGNLLTTAAAYPSTTTINGIAQTPDQQAAQVRNRIAQVSSNAQCAPFLPAPNCGAQGSQLLAVVPFDPTPRPVSCDAAGMPTGCIPGDADAATRLAACSAFTGASPVTYVANPAQLTAPAHGQWFGAISFNTVTPPAAYDGIRLDSPVGGLDGIKELFMTVEGDTVDPANRGPTYLTGVPDQGGRDVVHFDLIGPSASGSAALYVDLANDPVQF